jgi:hypothetical protein
MHSNYHQLKWSNVNEMIEGEDDTDDERYVESFSTNNCFLSESLLVITLRRNR